MQTSEEILENWYKEKTKRMATRSAVAGRYFESFSRAVYDPTNTPTHWPSLESSTSSFVLPPARMLLEKALGGISLATGFSESPTTKLLNESDVDSVTYLRKTRLIPVESTEEGLKVKKLPFWKSRLHQKLENNDECTYNSEYSYALSESNLADAEELFKKFIDENGTPITYQSHYSSPTTYSNSTTMTTTCADTCDTGYVNLCVSNGTSGFVYGRNETAGIETTHTPKFKKGDLIVYTEEQFTNVTGWQFEKGEKFYVQGADWDTYWLRVVHANDGKQKDFTVKAKYIDYGCETIFSEPQEQQSTSYFPNLSHV